jgi:hypothetical protein
MNVGHVQVGGGVGRVPPCSFNLCLLSSALICSGIGIRWVYAFCFDIPFFACWIATTVLGRKKMRKKYGIPGNVPGGMCPTQPDAFLCTGWIACKSPYSVLPKGEILQREPGSLVERSKVQKVTCCFFLLDSSSFGLVDLISPFLLDSCFFIKNHIQNMAEKKEKKEQSSPRSVVFIGLNGDVEES